MSKLGPIEPGTRFSRLTVIKPGSPVIRHRSRQGKVYTFECCTSICTCDCGNVVTVANVDLRHRHTRSCGCLKFGHPHRKPPLPAGYRSGKLTVIGVDSTVKIGEESRTLCKCDCGKVLSVLTRLLRPGSSRRQYSCGHDRRVGVYKNGASATKGVSPEQIRLGHIWRGIKARCLNPNTVSYKDYGARGITICDEWKNNFKAFMEWSLCNGYAQTLSIDRIDNSKGYCPSNCRWATSRDQQNNRRKQFKNSDVESLLRRIEYLESENKGLREETDKHKGESMKPEHVTLTIIQSSADDPHRFNVEVAGFGVPDFAIVAKNPKAAKDALKSYVYNELDGKEEISDE